VDVLDDFTMDPKDLLRKAIGPADEVHHSGGYRWPASRTSRTIMRIAEES
jgi:hypothetical protein